MNYMRLNRLICGGRSKRTNKVYVDQESKMKDSGSPTIHV
jgi:hypothetical protein